MEHDQPHAAQHDAALDAVHDLVADLAVGHVAPPGEHIGLGQHLLGQPMLRFVEGSGAHLETGLSGQRLGDHGVHAIRVHLGRLAAFMPLVAELIPDGNANALTHLQLLVKKAARSTVVVYRLSLTSYRWRIGNYQLLSSKWWSTVGLASAL